MRFQRFGPVLAVVIACAEVASAQQVARPPGEASKLARGWSQLESGDAAGAVRTATEALNQDQNSTAALTLLVDAELSRGGSPAGLRAYDRWLQHRRLDEAFVLRRIARALLVESSAAHSDSESRLQSLRALASDGDSAAAARLEDAASAGSFGETRVLAAMGDERAIAALISQLRAMPGSKTAIIDALGDSGSGLPVQHLLPLLSSADDLNRSAAAQALGRLGAADALPELRKLLNDPVFGVRLKAAGALLRLNDPSGAAFLNEVAQSEHATLRLAAARELSFQPDGAWQSLVHGLAEDPDPVVRVEAAALLAPFDPATSADVLQQLMRDDNIGVREAASAVYVSRAATDISTLRELLHSEQISVRVQAAAHVLELTR